MSTNRNLRRSIACLVLAGSAAVFTNGCGLGTTATNDLCAPNLQVKAQALEGALDDLTNVSAAMKTKLVTACAALATDLGQTPPDVNGNVSDDMLTQVCQMASAAIKAKVDATAHVVPVIVPGHCTVDAQAQFTCEGMCAVNGSCDPGSIQARCNPGDLSGECSGECMAGATCEGSASATAMCQGSCSATCVGSCSGNCVGTCDGTASSGACAGMCNGNCSQSCKGTCSGDCKIDANAMVMCGAQATCLGGCSVMVTNPTCEGQLNPPSCQNLDAECETACSGQGTIQATCTAPTVTIAGVGADATLVTTLQKNLPDVLAVALQAGLVVKAASQVSTTAQNVVTEVANSAGCDLVFGASFATKVTASVAASASITVSVMASAGVVMSVGG